MKLFVIYYNHDREVIEFGGKKYFTDAEVILAENKEKALEICSYPPKEMNEAGEEKTSGDFWTVKEINLGKPQVVLVSEYEESNY